MSRKTDGALGACPGVWRMFEEAQRLKELYGESAVLDFSVGNPNVEPPQEFCTVVAELAMSQAPGSHGYTSTAGYPAVRESVALFASREQGVDLRAGNIIMTCGAAGALNVILRTILDPGDEVIVPRPYYGEYDFYVENHGGLLKPVATGPDFALDVKAVQAACGHRTRAVLINSPNNPTGRVYPAETLASLAEVLAEQSRWHGRSIYLIADEPYRRIVYGGVKVPSILSVYANSLVVCSYSKELSLAGERIGYLIVNPRAAEADRLTKGLVFSTRVLGFVNAPALMQRAVAALGDRCVDLSLYERNRRVLVDALQEAGFTLAVPEGAFYLFPKSPLADDEAFVNELLHHRLVATPGSGFGCPGYFRLSFCVAPGVVDAALPIFKEVGRKYFGATLAGEDRRSPERTASVSTRQPSPDVRPISRTP